MSGDIECHHCPEAELSPISRDIARQWIESVFDSLKGQLGLEHHGARTLDGLYARVASKHLALSAGIWHNWKTNEPRKRSLIAYDH